MWHKLEDRRGKYGAGITWKEGESFREEEEIKYGRI
jgi:hypothetical protein